ncbi:MAG: MMPL family transporter [Actinomycetota bacterium]|nr:MMPL family transporter [Actinomycetota bacterium]
MEAWARTVARHRRAVAAASLVVAVLVSTYVLLLPAFRSLLARKAIVLNLLSIGAACGLLVAVFEWGLGGFLGGIRYDAITGWTPVFLFAMLFVLSMDYEVFLVSPMREESDATKHNPQVISLGRAKPGRHATATGPIMFAALIVAAAATFFPSSTPAYATVPSNCIGAPDLGPNASASYPEQRVFLEAQGWWSERQADGSVFQYGAAEHLHIGMCFPLQQTVSGSVRFDMRVMGHNLPVGALIHRTRLHDANGTTFVSYDWNRTVATMDEVYYATVTVNTALTSDGQRQFRILTDVTRPNGAEIRASSGWCWKFANGKTATGKTVANDSDCPGRTTGRGWYDCFEYKNVRADGWTYPYAGIASAPYSLPVRLYDGDGVNTLVTSHEVRLDPDFHNNIMGTIVKQGSGAFTGTVTLPAMSPGVHKLVLMTSANGNCTSGIGIVPQNGEVTGVQVIPIKVVQ